MAYYSAPFWIIATIIFFGIVFGLVKYACGDTDRPEAPPKKDDSEAANDNP
jgi:hypothetical protein